MLRFCGKVWQRPCKIHQPFLQSSTVAKKKKKGEYSKSVFLPKTDFPTYLEGKKVVERDLYIQKQCKFLEYYLWQRENLKGEEFILHDGPPYANGKPHIGHAINKIMKDIALRSQVIQGRRVHFIPGWDCHGLPIEMKAVTDSNVQLTAGEIREKARRFAFESSQVQMKAFKRWGVMGDWENQCYYTYDKSYVVNQLQTFWKIYEKGLIFHDWKPVYWSPSSKTALAESELIYKNDHKSHAVIVRLQIANESDSKSEPEYLLVWTTTPWTLPANKYVCYSSNIQYSQVKISSLPGSYIVAFDLVQNLQKLINQEIQVLTGIPNEKLKQMKYKHPWRKNQIKDVIESSHVTLSGTGLVHSAPSHGHEDYNVAMKHGFQTLQVLVDESGRFNGEAGPELEGLSVLEEGSQRVVDLIKADIVFEEDYVHSYPYDWRTDKPVIIRASKQWFIDTEALKNIALESLSQVSVQFDHLRKLIETRPYWCLSRQRVWGVPIPVLYHKLTGRALISRSSVDHLCNLIESHGSDVWWNKTTRELFPPKLCTEHFVEAENVAKGADIMDIWFDSGISWSAVLDGSQADICIEGKDQHRGWFQSSLLTCAALEQRSPYKKLLTHGFAVDEEGKKMSKSIGNVVDPEVVVDGEEALGVDVLRWWVASQTGNMEVPVSKRLLSENQKNLQRIRLVLRFILGALHDLSAEERERPSNLCHLDIYTLNKCRELYSSVMGYYNENKYNLICLAIINFTAIDISAKYITAVKDRLYCDESDSVRRRACRYVLHGILTTLSHCMAPIVPHLAEEIFLHHPFCKGELTVFYNQQMWRPPSSWNDQTCDAVVELALKIKAEVDAMANGKPAQLSCSVQAEEEGLALLRKMQEEDLSADSELTEILQVSSVRLKSGSMEISLAQTQSCKCPRCRRFTSVDSKSLCARCEKVVSPAESS